MSRAGGASLRGNRSGLLPNARMAGPMPWVIAIMIALTVIASAAGLSLKNVAANARHEIAGSVTVQLVEAAPARREAQAREALALLSARDDVAAVERVPDAELMRLLEPWLGAAAARAGDDAIPLPAMIDLRLKGPSTPARLADLRAQLSAVAPSVRVDAQAGWLGPVFRAITSVQVLAAGLVALLAATSAGAVWLSARSALGANRDTIEVVHLLGGTDGQIARLFQNSIGVDAAVGGLAGLGMGLVAVVALGQQFAALGAGIVAGGGLGLVDWAVLVMIPLIGIALAMLTARLTVLTALRGML